MKKINTLVVGQGIAGTLVAFMLHLHDIPFTVIDTASPNTSSRIAAGMFSPISGKRKTISSMAPQQISFAISMYREIGRLLGATILHLHNIYQVHHSASERSELIGKLENAGFAKYIITDPRILPFIKQRMGAYEISLSGWVDCGLMINGFARWLKDQQALVEDEFLYADLLTGYEVMEYHGMEFYNIVFCEGYRAIDNPFFKNEHIIPCKGDMLTIEYDSPATCRIIKKNGMYLVPAGNNTFRAGATYQWNNNSLQPDKAARSLIEKGLDAMLENKFATIDHQTAIRPTTQNREVVAKQHTQHAGMYMLNGLGTKGVMLGPWWANHLVRLLLQS